MASPRFARDLARLAPQIVVHCAGPFQGQDYRVAQAANAAGAHYLDLADGRDFVAGFAAANNAAANAAGVLAVSGASTLPALSSAVIDTLALRLATIEEIRIYIAPGQRAPRGIATLAAVFSYAGRQFTWLSGGAWRDAVGWQELRRINLRGVGKRWAAACDVPDLALLPLRYASARTVEFRAALEMGMQHFALWFVAALRRVGLPVPIERWAGALERIARVFDWFAGERGGMLIEVIGSRTGAERALLTWSLNVPARDGPEIPCMPAILLVQKLARDELSLRGAHACMGMLSLEEFLPQFQHWGVHTALNESAA